MKLQPTSPLLGEKRFKDLGIPCFEPFGAFYIFPNISQFGLTSEEFAMRLVEEERLAVVPGTAFGDSGKDSYVSLTLTQLKT